MERDSQRVPLTSSLLIILRRFDNPFSGSIIDFKHVFGCNVCGCIFCYIECRANYDIFSTNTVDTLAKFLREFEMCRWQISTTEQLK